LNFIQITIQMPPKRKYSEQASCSSASNRHHSDVESEPVACEPVACVPVACEPEPEPDHTNEDVKTIGSLRSEIRRKYERSLRLAGFSPNLHAVSVLDHNKADFREATNFRSISFKIKKVDNAICSIQVAQNRLENDLYLLAHNIAPDEDKVIISSAKLLQMYTRIVAMNEAIIETERCLSSAHNEVMQKQNEVVECVAKISGNVLKYLDVTIDDMWKTENL
jgi:hypothetical protein